ncbi:hypothetical protein EVAR_62190_1 [Eumeta japonica]|uniref:Uncharacterized protein n=1 Tax=Eumeta variegata TaxID=151549 RepID=A0A4C1Z661_EUMVA|nr:hypothetical protein EVAR_62190_1 [Eumeta japonica]
MWVRVLFMFEENSNLRLETELAKNKRIGSRSIGRKVDEGSRLSAKASLAIESGCEISMRQGARGPRSKVRACYSEIKEGLWACVPTTDIDADVGFLPSVKLKPLIQLSAPSLNSLMHPASYPPPSARSPSQQIFISYNNLSAITAESSNIAFIELYSDSFRYSFRRSFKKRLTSTSKVLGE